MPEIPKPLEILRDLSNASKAYKAVSQVRSWKSQIAQSSCGRSTKAIIAWSF